MLQYDESSQDLAIRIATHQQYSPFKLEQLLSEIVSRCAGRLLDAGCGTGNFTELLSVASDSYVGLDRNAGLLLDARAAAAAAGARNVRFVHATLDDDLPFRSGSFSIVLYVYSAYYARDAAALLQSARRVLAVPGKAVLVGPTAGNGVELDELSRVLFGVAASPEKDARIDRLREEFVPAARACFGEVRSEERDFSLRFPDPTPYARYYRATPQYRELERRHGSRSEPEVAAAIRDVTGLRLTKRAFIVVAGKG
jgi:SAM-dependent methyltransferase